MKKKKESFPETQFAAENLKPLEEISEVFRRFSKKIFIRELEATSNNLIFVGMLILFYGCYQTLNKKYSEHFSSTFLKNSLPIFQSVSQKLNWETVAEIGLREIVPLPDTNVQTFSFPLISSSFLQRIEVNDTANIVSILFHSPWSQIKKQEFIALFPINNLKKNYNREDSLFIATPQIGRAHV